MLFQLIKQFNKEKNYDGITSARRRTIPQYLAYTNLRRISTLSVGLQKKKQKQTKVDEVETSPMLSTTVEYFLYTKRL